MVNPETPYRRPPFVLIITGQEWVSLSMVTIFSPKGYAVLRSFSGGQALERVRETAPDLLIIDQELRDMRGTEFCRSLREQTAVGATTPILMISTGPWQREARLEALREGAWDVCSLPMDSEEMFLKADAWVRAKLAADDKSDQGLLDPDTGLYNTQGLLRRIAELAAGAVRHGRPLACVVLSAEPLSPAELGSAAVTSAQGQGTWTTATAKSFAAKLMATGRASDAIGRLSPTEFVIVAPDTDDDGVLGLAARLRRAVSAEEAPSRDTALQIRLGYYAVPDMRNASIAPTEVLIRAAEALRSVDPGHGTVRFFTASPDTLN